MVVLTSVVVVVADIDVDLLVDVLLVGLRRFASSKSIYAILRCQSVFPTTPILHSSLWLERNAGGNVHMPINPLSTHPRLRHKPLPSHRQPPHWLPMLVMLIELLSPHHHYTIPFLFCSLIIVSTPRTRGAKLNPAPLSARGEEAADRCCGGGFVVVAAGGVW